MVTVTDSENTTEMSMTAPALYMPLAVLDTSELTVGTAVSKGMVNAVAAIDGLPLRSVQAPTPEVMDAVPDDAAVGVTVAVYEVPEPAQAERVPPLTVNVLAAKVVEVSLKVAVIVAVCPLSSDARVLVNVTVGLE